MKPAASPLEGLQSASEEIESITSEVEDVLAANHESGWSRWKFWKRPPHRGQHVQAVREGTSEMLDVLRSIRDHLESAADESHGSTETLSPLPVASFDRMSESQADTSRALGELRQTLENRSEKDDYLVRSLDRLGKTMARVEDTFRSMGHTLSSMDRSNQRAVSSIDELGGRMSESDRFMTETFARLQDSERQFTDELSRHSRAGRLGMAALCCMLMLSVFAVGFMFRENRELLSAIQRSGALVVQVPADPPREMALFEELDQVDDGIGEPDREIVRARGAESSAGGRNASSEIRDPLLSANELPRRK